VFILKIDLTLTHFSRFSSQISDESLTEARQEGESTQDPSGKIMTSCTFNIKFPCVTQFIFGLLMFVTGEDGKLELLTRGPMPVYGKATYYPAEPSKSGRACSGLNPCIRTYYLAAMTSQGISIRATISQPSTRTVSSTSSGASPYRDSTEDYPEIGGSCYWNLDVEVALSACWPQHLPRTAPAGTLSSGDQRCSMPGCLMTDWLRT
jgi:hypothetical protein